MGSCESSSKSVVKAYWLARTTLRTGASRPATGSRWVMQPEERAATLSVSSATVVPSARGMNTRKLVANVVSSMLAACSPGRRLRGRGRWSVGGALPREPAKYPNRPVAPTPKRSDFSQTCFFSVQQKIAPPQGQSDAPWTYNRKGLPSCCSGETAHDWSAAVKEKTISCLALLLPRRRWRIVPSECSTQHTWMYARIKFKSDLGSNVWRSR
jgi:hypothetical protein